MKIETKPNSATITSAALRCIKMYALFHRHTSTFHNNLLICFNLTWLAKISDMDLSIFMISRMVWNWYWQSQNARHYKYDWTKEGSGQRLHSCKMLNGYLSHCPSLTSIAPRVIHRSLKSSPDITFILSDVEVGIKPILTPRLVDDTSSLHLLQLTK